MFNQFEAPAHIVAVGFSGRMREDDVERFGSLLDAALEHDGAIHLYAEILGFEGFDRGALDEMFDIGKTYLANLRRFGRIAIVADKPWIRAASRLESLLLPHVSYEVFPPEERERALAWVKGNVDRPWRTAFRMLPSDDPRLIAFEVEGKLRDDEIAPLFAAVSAVPSHDDPLRLLGRIKTLDGFDWRLLTDPDYLRLKLQLLKAVDRYAIVGGPAWLATWLRLVDPLVRMQIRHFDPADEESAWRWLRERDEETPQRAEELVA